MPFKTTFTTMRQMRPRTAFLLVSALCVLVVTVVSLFGLVRPLRQEDTYLKDNDSIKAVNAATRVSLRANGTIFITVINDAYLIFAYSWLCNTKEMGIHDTLLIITHDQASKEKLSRDWPQVEVVTVNFGGMRGNQQHLHAGYARILEKRTELINAIINADITLILIEMDSVWLANPLSALRTFQDGADLMVTLATGMDEEYAFGFLYLFSTKKTKVLWTKLTERMRRLGAKLASKRDDAVISLDDNDQMYLSKLLINRYGGVKFRVLPSSLFADGMWYTQEDQNATRPLIINNNWISGNNAKIDRAKKWKHWFIRDDWSCDMDLVRRTVYSSS